jgi:hypothetical protein
MRRINNRWVLTFLVLAGFSFGLTYGILTLMRSNNGVESVVPINSQIGVGTEANIQQPPPPTGETTSGAESEPPADQVLDSPESELSVGDVLETIITTADGDEITTKSPADVATAAPSGAGDAAGGGSVVEFTITRGGQ